MRIHLFLLFLGISTLAFAQQSQPFPKVKENTFYQIQDGKNFYKYNPKEKNYTEIKKNTDQLKVNAAGYNIKDNFIYGIEMNSNQLIQISADGKFKKLGIVKGLPMPKNKKSYIAGDVDTSGNLYVYNGIEHHSLYKINIKAKTAKSVYTSNDKNQARLGDFSFIPSQNKFYGINTKQELISIDAKTGKFSPGIQIQGIKENLSPLKNEIREAVFGASYADNKGFLYCFHNKTGRLYRVNINTNIGQLVHPDGTTLKLNDGASNIFTEIKIKSCEEKVLELEKKVVQLEKEIKQLKGK